VSTWLNEDYVRWLYKSLLRRDPDPDGMRFFVERLERGDDLKRIVQDMVNSDEYREKANAEERDPGNLGALLAGAVRNLANPLSQHIPEWTRQGAEHAFYNKEMAALYYEDSLLRGMLETHGEKFVAKHNTHVFSQTYEDAAIAEIFSRIGTGSKTFVELGTEDGNQNTTRLLLELGWRGLWVEGGEEHVRRIQRNFRTEIEENRLIVRQAFITAENIGEIVESAGLGLDIDFLSVDIDQNTSHVWRALPLRPRVACIEYNAHFPPSVDYEAPYVADRMWDGSNLYGGSLKAMERIGRAKSMSLVGCDLMGVNAYFVSDACLGDHFLQPFTAERHYQPPRFRFVRGSRGHPHADRR
jgi:hypothetical protein